MFDPGFTVGCSVFASICVGAASAIQRVPRALVDFLAAAATGWACAVLAAAEGCFAAKAASGAATVALWARLWCSGESVSVRAAMVAVGVATGIAAAFALRVN
ncbi:hypothetical protein EDD75_0418 [Thermodesulfitimonas autotrophica]|uniref:Uncharacterized protein n=1 Tax=Thermodesulfitimonas autotrophica TaxID=1894989 RepID=A0A3N5B1V2_9THEO|nr:hypothetical protein [Thermodesulfitimonas autotrophica]RPF49600.1 hypothetical protein EDD75_0418 [Thermodesulfitimonas autotrophica]